MTSHSEWRSWNRYPLSDMEPTIRLCGGLYWFDWGKSFDLRCHGHSHAWYERAGPNETPCRWRFDDPRRVDHGTFRHEPGG